MRTRHPSNRITFVAASVIYLGAAMPALAQTASISTSAPAAALPPGVVATVNGVNIAQTQLDALVRASGQPDSAKVRKALRQELIVRELFRQQAEKAHYGEKPEVQDVTNAAKANAETQLYLKDTIRPEPVTDAQVRERYDEIVAALGKEEYKPRLIALSDEATANTVLAQLKAGNSFDALARRYSTAQGRASGGELPWVSLKTPLTEGKTQGLPLPVAQAITLLPPGGVTPVAIRLGAENNAPRVIVKLDAKRPTQVPGFDQAKDTIRQQLQALALQKAAVQLTGRLLKDATIQQ
ncbi:peptidyl-prolyl cis-trans isomerase (plasmid) [Paraburkholderia sp. PREW-6R]|uniref:peptidylprolyl isomerase n=1 Tax=Paraburkholderia sp. PREW-6R TaxID=3141544 RepID=UPI0031F535B7